MSVTPESLQVVSRRGRPTRGGEPATKRREFRLTPPEDQDLKAISRETGAPVATIVRDAVNEYVSDFRERQVFGPRKPA